MGTPIITIIKGVMMQKSSDLPKIEVDLSEWSWVQF